LKTTADLLKSKILSTFLLGCLFAICTCGWAQDRNDFQRFGVWLKEDPVSIFSNINTRQLAIYGTAGLTVAYLTAFDESSSSSFQRNYSESRFLAFSNTFGSKKVILPAAAALFGSSLLTNNTRFQDAAFTSLQSVLMTSLTVGAGKFLFARERPFENDGAYDFDFVSMGQTSFPSGHTAKAFAFVTPWVMYYPNAFTYTLLAIPAGTAVARVARGKHWLSDVAAGAAIGFSMGYYLSRRHLGKENIQITPSFGETHAALSVNIRF